MAGLGFEPRHLAPESMLKSPLRYAARLRSRLPSELDSFLDMDVAWNHKHTITPLPLKTLPTLSLHQPRRVRSHPPAVDVTRNMCVTGSLQTPEGNFLGRRHLSTSTPKFPASQPLAWVGVGKGNLGQRGPGSGGHSAAITQQRSFLQDRSIWPHPTPPPIPAPHSVTAIDYSRAGKQMPKYINQSPRWQRDFIKTITPSSVLLPAPASSAQWPFLLEGFQELCRHDLMAGGISSIWGKFRPRD